MIVKSSRVLLMLLFFCFPLYAAEIQFDAKTDKTELPLNEYLVYSLTVKGDVSPLPEPVIDSLEDFNIYGSGRSQNISFVNGKKSGSVTFSYTLAPKKTGKLTIPPAKIEYDKKTYFTESVDVEVTEAVKRQPAEAQTRSARFSGAGNGQASQTKTDVFVKASVNRKNAYVNEKLIYKFSFYTNVDLISNPAYYAPDFAGFLKGESTPSTRNETIEGVNYLVNEIETVIYPIESGNLTVGPAKLAIAVMDFSSSGSADDFFNLFVNMGRRKEKTLETNEVIVNVMPLPLENRPDNFKGAVGNFKINASVNKTEARTDEAVILTVKVTGTGNMRSVNDVNFEAGKDFKVYDTVASDTTENSRELQILMMPLAPGEKTIGPFRLYFFNPESKKYEYAQTQPIKIKVEGAPASAAEGAAYAGGIINAKKDVRYNKQIEKVSRYYYGYLLKNKIFWLALTVYILFFAGLWLAGFHVTRRNSDPVFKLRNEALKLSKKCIIKAGGKIKSGECHDFYEYVHDALVSAVTAKTAADSSGLPAGEIVKKLERTGFDKEKTKEAEEILNLMNFYRFASVKSDQETMRALLSKAEKIIEALEK